MTILQRGTGNTRGGAVSFALDVADLPDLISRQGVPASNAPHFDNIGRNSSTWYGGLTGIEDARKLILDGWYEGAGKASAVTQDDGLTSTLPQPESIRRRMTWGADGDDLNIDRALRGDWDTAYRTSHRVKTTGNKIVTLVSSFGGNCGKSAEQLFWSGAQMLVTAELLELAGYQCEVRGIHFNDFRSTTKKLALDICCKKAGDPLRLDTIASVFAHAGVFRTYGFMGICRAPWPVTSGLGHALEDSGAERMFSDLTAKGILDPADVFLPPAYSRETAIRNILGAVHHVTEGENHD